MSLLEQNQNEPSPGSRRAYWKWVGENIAMGVIVVGCLLAVTAWIIGAGWVN